MSFSGNLKLSVSYTKTDYEALTESHISAQVVFYHLTNSTA